jgi:hypothetical protein
MWREAIAVWRVARDPDLGDVGVLAADTGKCLWRVRSVTEKVWSPSGKDGCCSEREN